MSGFPKDYLEPITAQGKIFSSPGPIEEVHGELSMMSLFPGSLEYYEYEGSMTSAPCSGGVRRIVFVNSNAVGDEQACHIIIPTLN